MDYDQEYTNIEAGNILSGTVPFEDFLFFHLVCLSLPEAGIKTVI
jgi:hypothetical protein